MGGHLTKYASHICIFKHSFQTFLGTLGGLAVIVFDFERVASTAATLFEHLLYFVGNLIKVE